MNDQINPALNWVSLQIEPFLLWVTSSEFDRKYSPNTIRAMNQALVSFSSYIGKSSVESPNEVNIAVIRGFRYHLHVNGLSLSTIRQRLSVIDFFFDFMLTSGLVGQNPVEELKNSDSSRKRRGGRIKKRLPSVIALADQDELIRLTLNTEKQSAVRDAALLGLFLDSGLRVEEMIGLTLAHGVLMLNTGKVRVVGKGDKERLVTPMNHYIDQWGSWIESRRSLPDESPLFPSRVQGDFMQPMSQQGVYKVVHRALTRCGVHAPQMGAHLLRHSAASRMLHDGRTLKEVQETLGHESITTTELYLHLL